MPSHIEGHAHCIGSQLAWYAVHTKPRQEQRARLNLQQQGYTCYLPTLAVQKIRRGNLVTQSEPLFARYLFIELDSSQGGKSWGPIRSTLGVSRLVSFGADPAKISSALIDKLRQENGSQQFKEQKLFERGDEVQITEGAFAGLNAIYQMEDGENRAMVLIDILSKACRLALSPAHLLKAA